MIKFTANLETVGEAVGAMKAVTSIVNDDAYINGLAVEAHRNASEKFDMAASAPAATGSIQHMFEFGVAGITRGPVRISDPTSVAARLWVHNLSGNAGNYQANFIFRPATIRNPQPTTAYTGVPSKYLRKLSKRKYVFRQKAFVMETGMEVTIRPRNGTSLFVPFYGEEPKDPRNAKRGYMMYPGSITTTQGANTRGNFTKFWGTWWNSVGDKMITNEIQTKVDVEVRRALDAAAKRAASAPKSPRASNTKSAASRAQRETASAMKRTANRRGGNSRK